MAQPYIGEIRLFAGNFAPVGWAFCDGQPLAISENEALFQLIGTTYGGDGQETFNLPNLQSRVSMHFGTGPDGASYPLALATGVEDVTLTVPQIPAHSHTLFASSAPGAETIPIGNLTGTPLTKRIYAAASAPTPMNAATTTPVGGSQPHTNCQPFLCLNYIISLFGIFPSQT